MISPTPWKRESLADIGVPDDRGYGAGVVDVNGHYVAQVFPQLEEDEGFPKLSPRGEENRCLILAAPDLLAACEAASSQVPTWSREGELSDVYRQISSAIAKAKGEAKP